MIENMSITTAVLLLGISMCGCQQATDSDSLTSKLKNQIENKAASDSVLLESISHLGRVVEPREFWINIANNEDYSRQHRSRCTMALFRRHASHCTSVRQLAERIAPAGWLRDEDIDVIQTLAGSIPVTPGLDRTVFVIQVFPGTESAVYVSVLGEMQRDEFSRIVRSDGEAGDGVILEIGFADDYEQWFYGR